MFISKYLYFIRFPICYWANTRVRLNILSFVSYDVLGFVLTPLVHKDSPRAAQPSSLCHFSKRFLGCFRVQACTVNASEALGRSTLASVNQSVSGEKVQSGQ